VLAVAPASADGYAEKASLPLFTSLVWTPPSFAEGRIYARDSYGEIAAIDIVPARTPAAPSPSVAAAPISPFAKQVADAEASPEGAARLRRFLDERRGSPIVQDDRHVTFVYRGPERDVSLRGDWLEINKEQPLRPVAGTDIQYAAVDLPPDARVVYQLAKPDGTAFADPANPDTGDSLNYVGPVSFLYMPRSERPPAIDPKAPLQGTMTELELEAEPQASAHLKWGGKRKLHVYLPPGYESQPDRRYPTLYVLYGDEIMNGLHLPVRLDREIGKSLPPLVAVFIPSTSPYEYARTFQDAHRTWLAERVVPFVDSRFRTLADPKARTLFGVDEGGYAVVYTALRAPGLFGNVIGQSVFPVGQGEAQLLALASEASPAPVRFYLDWGRYDPHRTSDRTDVAGFTRTLSERLRARGYPVESRESPDGSAHVFWADRLMPALRQFFPVEAGRP
jgi:enterochelin esterase family protein